MEKVATGQERWTSRAILVVDHDAEARRLLVDLLRDEGFTVAEAPNGKVALDLLLGAPEPPALVLLDLNLPLMSGWEVIRVMRGHLRLAKVPVGLVTSEPRRSEFPAEAIAGHLQKPYAAADLLVLVRRHVRAEPSDGTGAAA